MQWPFARKDKLDSHARIIDTTLDPIMLSFNHIRRWESHLVREKQVTLNDMALLVSEISVFDKYHTTCLACAHIYVGCDTIVMNIPQKAIFVESQKCGMILTYPKISPLDQRAPGNGNC